MARPLSDEKRTALVDACIDLLALHGVDGVSTAAISSRAGVAEGTLFRYFASKDVLFSEVYRSIKRGLAQHLLPPVPDALPTREQLRLLWIAYVHWIRDHRREFLVLRALDQSARVSESARSEGKAAFQRIDRLASMAIASGEVRDLPLSFLSLAFNSLAIATLESLATGESARAEGIERGFEVFWRGIAT